MQCTEITLYHSISDYVFNRIWNLSRPLRKLDAIMERLQLYENLVSRTDGALIETKVALLHLVKEKTKDYA